MIILVDEKHQNHFVTKTGENTLSLIKGICETKICEKFETVFILSSERLKAFPPQ